MPWLTARVRRWFRPTLCLARHIAINGRGKWSTLITTIIIATRVVGARPNTRVFTTTIATRAVGTTAVTRLIKVVVGMGAVTIVIITFIFTRADGTRAITRVIIMMTGTRAFTNSIFKIIATRADAIMADGTLAIGTSALTKNIMAIQQRLLATKRNIAGTRQIDVTRKFNDVARDRNLGSRIG